VQDRSSYRAAHGGRRASALPCGVWTAVTIGALAWVAGAGCTVNGRTILGDDARRYFENSARTGRSVMIDAWGINLSTVRGDGGLTVGRTRRTYYFPGPASTQPAGATDRPSGDTARVRLAATRPFDLACAPLAVIGRSDGLSVGSGMTGVHVTAGVHAFAAVRLPPDASTRLFLRSDTRRPAEDVFDVKECRR
jgi:hypothetical protein